MTIPASGKTVLINAIKNFMANVEGKFLEIHSDVLTLEAINDYLAKYGDVSKNEAFQKSRKQAKAKYEGGLKYICHLAKSIISL